MKIVISSNNKHKIEEIKKILSSLDIEVYSLKQLNIDINPIENGKTFEENALIKARALKECVNEEYIILADDSGLCVDYLNGAPGIYSSRYGNEHGNAKKNNEKLMKELENVPLDKRTAKFVCAVVLICNNKEYVVRGETNGIILDHPEGEEGFGYDPYFFNEEMQKSFSNMTSEEKESVSHRGNALKKVVEIIEDIL